MTIHIGILGGTFDPVHNGHLHLANKASEKLRLSKVIFIPTYLPPHKKGIRVTPVKHRYNMLKAAIKGNKKFSVSSIEIGRKGKSYTVDTLKTLRKKYGSKTELFFITGSDSLRELDKWKNLDEILSLCRFVIAKRPGFKIKNPLREVTELGMSAKDISSTMLRERIKNGKSIDVMVPKAVDQYIKEHHLYLDATT